MTKRSHLEVEQLEKLRLWIREERHIRGWSARKLSEESRLAAKRRGRIASVSQQSISSFESGHNKSIPAWISLLADAFDDTPPHGSLPLNSQIRPVVAEKTSTKEKTDKNPCVKKIPPEHDLKKIFLSLLAPMEVNLSDSWSLKQQIATSLAKRFPVVMSHPQAFVDM